MKKIFFVFLTLALVSASLFATGSQQTQSYPNKPVTCIIPYPPGGGSDVLTRAVMAAIKLPNGQPLVAINTEGAAGFTGAVRAYNSAPDGYTIMTHNTMDLLAYYVSGQDNIPIVTEAEVIAWVVSDFNLVSTNKTAAAQYGWRTIEDVVAWCRNNPNQKLRWGAVGAQTVNMVDSQRIARALGIFDSIIWVPYDGGASTRNAALANEIQLETCTASEVPGVLASGDNIPLLTVNGSRIALIPNVPTTVEKGVNVSTPKPRGYFAPKGTSPEAIRVLSAALKDACEDPGFRSTIERLGFVVEYVDGQRGMAQTRIWLNELKPFFDEFLRN